MKLSYTKYIKDIEQDGRTISCDAYIVRAAFKTHDSEIEIPVAVITKRTATERGQVPVWYETVYKGEGEDQIDYTLAGAKRDVERKLSEVIAIWANFQ